ncbi:adenylylsulfate kinase [Burkholderia pseudomallei]|nr:adenylylsulfate kinase [Burkholderia pseudomallei]
MNMKGGFPPEAVAPVIWMTGLPGAGKTTTANALAERLLEDGAKAIVLDGDALRSGLCADLGFSDADRMENIRRFAHVAKLFQREGYVVIVATISRARSSAKAFSRPTWRRRSTCAARGTRRGCTRAPNRGG